MAVLDYFCDMLGLLRTDPVADVGSGTGILSELFLAHGNPVFGIEPNEPMRIAAESLLARFPNFHSLAGSAEDTGLDAQSVRFVVAGQAFHWFDPPRARDEFKRILDPGGSVVLIWNERRGDDTPFSRAYRSLVEKHSIDHDAVKQRTLNAVDEAVLKAFFGPAGFRKAQFPNSQSLDFTGLLDRLASSSYLPPPGHPRFESFAVDARLAFDRHEIDGQVQLIYDTDVYSGILS